MNEVFSPDELRRKNGQCKFSLGKVYLFLLSLDIAEVEELSATSDKGVTDTQDGGEHE